MIDHSAAHGYPEPVRLLLEIGEPGPSAKGWPDYPQRYGLEQQHVDDLIRMAVDPSLDSKDSDATAMWATVHASRALGQLRALESVPILLRNLLHLDSLDVQAGEFPWVMCAFGPGAIPHVLEFIVELDDDPVDSCDDDSAYPLNLAIETLGRLGAEHLEGREECVSMLVAKLEQEDDDWPEINGFVVGALLDLRAVEALDTIRRAFERNAVDVSIPGDLEDVEIELGVREKRSSRRPRHHPGFDESLAARPRSGRDNGSYMLDNRPAKSTKVGRNEPCPCGSGKKYKKCCGNSNKQTAV